MRLKATPLDSQAGNGAGSDAGGNTANDVTTVLVSDNGRIINAPSLGSTTGTGGASAGGAGSGGTTTTTVTSGTSPFVLNITWDSSVASAPSGFTAGVTAAVQYLESQFVDPVTININVGYGEVGGNSLGSNALGSSLTYLSNYAYSQITGALSADTNGTTDSSAIASLPGTSPLSGANYWVTTAEAKALGLMGASTSVDGYVGFSSTLPFDYINSDGVTAGTYDFFGTVVHELSEVMGRMMLTGTSLGGFANSYDVLDLFHYSSSGVRDFSAATPGYFSVDGGKTSLGGFNTVAGGDAGDWGSAMGNDAFNAFSYSGVVNAVSNSDLMTLDAIGWNAAGAAVATPPTGVALTPATYGGAAVNSSNLAAGTAIATAHQAGGTATDSYSYTLGGTSGGLFALDGGTGALKVGGTALAGTTGGTVYNLTVTANDTTQGVSSPAAPVAVAVGTGSGDTISIGAALDNATTTPAFIYGLGGNDLINGAGMTSALWIAGGAGADSMRAGSGADTFAYAAVSDSTASAMDIISSFNAATDLIDLTGLGVSLSYAGQIGGLGRLAPHSIGWQVSGGQTYVYVNTSNSAERVSSGAAMKIDLVGQIALTSADFRHA